MEGRNSEDFWTRKSEQWEEERRSLEATIARLDRPSAPLAVTGAEILELAKQVGFRYRTQDPAEQRRLPDTVLSNCTFDCGSLSPTYNKPFDLFVRGNESGNWRRGRDSVQTRREPRPTGRRPEPPNERERDLAERESACVCSHAFQEHPDDSPYC